MKVIVSGSSGLAGSALVGELSAGGDIVTRLQRSFPKEKKGGRFIGTPGPEPWISQGSRGRMPSSIWPGRT